VFHSAQLPLVIPTAGAKGCDLFRIVAPGAQFGKRDVRRPDRLANLFYGIGRLAVT
jgi:hypothetical protein